MTKSLRDKIQARELAIAKQLESLKLLKEKDEKAENGAKFVLAGAVLSYARKNPSFAKQLFDIIESEVTRPYDQKRISYLSEDIKNMFVNEELNEAAISDRLQKVGLVDNPSVIVTSFESQGNENAPRRD